LFFLRRPIKNSTIMDQFVICMMLMFVLTSVSFLVYIHNSSTEDTHPGQFAPVKACSTEHIDLYAIPTRAMFDNTHVSPGDTVLLNHQHLPGQNGIYEYMTPPVTTRTNRSFCVWQRHGSLIHPEQAIIGKSIRIEQGDANSGTTMVLQIVATHTHELPSMKFVTLADMLLPRSPLDTGVQVLSTDSVHTSGLKWIPLSDLHPPRGRDINHTMFGTISAHSYKMVPILIERTHATIPVQLNSVWIYMHKSDTHDRKHIQKVDIAFSETSDGSPCACVLHTSKSADDISVECHNIDGTQTWWSPQKERGILMCVENNSDEAWDGHILWTQN
jgi:hypothetical protein